MQKQVAKEHYEFGKYVTKQRWASVWHQLDEITRLTPNNVLEIGPGPGIFKAAARSLGYCVETLDIDPDLKPDHVASVFAMPFDDRSFDVVCAFQMLEHLPFERSLQAFKEMVRVSGKAIVISLPDAATRWPFTGYIPKFGLVSFSIPRPRIRPKKHVFDGEHYWEINKADYPLSRIIKSLTQDLPITLVRTYRVPENPYHRFFVYSKN